MKRLTAVLGTVLLLLMTACGGNGGGGSNPSPPSQPSVNASPATSTVQPGATQVFTLTTSNTTATPTVTITSPASGGGSFSAVSGSGNTFSTTYTAPAQVTADVSVSATVSAGGATATISIKVPAPVLTISNVAAGNITAGGATIAWATNLAATCKVNYGTTSGYGSSTAVEAAGSTSHTATLTGLAASTVYHYQVACGSTTTADATFTTAAPAPAIGSITPPDLYCQAGGCLIVGAEYQINGSGFGANPTVKVSGAAKLGQVSPQSDTVIKIGLITDSTTTPGDVQVTVQTAAGTSNTGHIFYLPWGNTLRLDSSYFYEFDSGGAWQDTQGNTNHGKLVVVDRATGSVSRLIPSGASVAFAEDATTGDILTTSKPGGDALGVHHPDGSSYGIYNGKQVMQPAGLDHVACVSQPQDGLLSVKYDTSQPPPINTVPTFDYSFFVGGQPMPMDIAKVGTHHYCSTLDVANMIGYVVDVEAQSKVSSSTLTSFTAVANVPAHHGLWLASLFTSHAYVAYVSVFDHKVDFVNRDTGAEVRTVDLTALGGTIGAVTADDATGTLLVAIGYGDSNSGTTKVYRLDPTAAGGNPAVIGQASVYGQTGLALDTKTGKVYVSSGSVLPVAVN